MSLKDFIAGFKPGYDPIPLPEKIRSGLAVMLGTLLMGMALRFLPQVGYPPAMLASMAASAALLYAAPHSPMAQPWPLVGGHFVSALVGWTCSLYIADPVIAAAIAVGMAVFIMYLLNCLHPSGAATALILVLNAAQFHQYGWQWVTVTVVANTALSLLLALVINNLIPGRRYPMHRDHLPQQSRFRAAGQPVELGTDDIEWALRKMDSVIDVSEEDLLDIYRLACGHAMQRTAR
jgi:CBS domain-containing membrane protein